MISSTKQNLIRAFLQMKALEESARDFYLKAVQDEAVPEEARRVFDDIAKDEARHSQIVQKIVNIITNNL